MSKKYIVILCSLLSLLTACHKDNGRPPLPDGSVVFQHAAGGDTLETPVSVLSDSAMVVGLIAEISGKMISAADHWVGFSIDTTKISDYRARYGDALLLPSSSYYLYRAMAKISAGAFLSDSGQINILHETGLQGYSTYVLPVVIQTVDGQSDGAASNQVLYLVFKTGKPAFLGKDGWTIAAYSSALSSANGPANLLDKDEVSTYWASSLTGQMPQYVTINFNSDVTFSAVNYYLPSLITAATGGYPTSVQIETSMDGVSWNDNGTFACSLGNNNMQTLNTGVTTAAYLRFTALASAIYYGYNIVAISGIKLTP